MSMHANTHVHTHVFSGRNSGQDGGCYLALIRWRSKPVVRLLVHRCSFVGTWLEWTGNVSESRWVRRFREKGLIVNRKDVNFRDCPLINASISVKFFHSCVLSPPDCWVPDLRKLNCQKQEVLIWEDIRYIDIDDSQNDSISWLSSHD
jgi:hypothetical protein